jgi:hypothetical protein
LFQWLKAPGSSVVCRFSSHFHSAYLTYGAISELSTLEGYGVLARRTQNPILAEIVVRRLAKDERRHFSLVITTKPVGSCSRATHND